MRLQRVQVICGALCVGGCGENRAIVVAQDLQPRLKVGRMILAGLQLDIEIGSQEGSTEFRDEFLAGVAFVTEALAAEASIQPVGMARPVRQLVRQRRVVAFRVAEGFDRRDTDHVAVQCVVRFRTTDADISAGCGDEILGAGDPFRTRCRRLRLHRVVRGQVLDLIRVEDRVAFEERDVAFDLLAVLVFLDLAEGVRVDDGRAIFAFADMGAELVGLTERQPVRRCKAEWLAVPQRIRIFMPR